MILDLFSRRVVGWSMDETMFVPREVFQTRAEAKTRIFAWVEAFYNRTPMHSTLGYRLPEQHEREMKVA